MEWKSRTFTLHLFLIRDIRCVYLGERDGGWVRTRHCVLLSPAICVTFLPPDKRSHSLSSLEFLSSKTLTQDRGVRCKVTSYLSGCHVVVVVVVNQRDRQALHQLLHPHRDDIQVRRESTAGVHVKHALVPLHLGHSRSDNWIMLWVETGWFEAFAKLTYCSG